MELLSIIGRDGARDNDVDNSSDVPQAGIESRERREARVIV